MNGYILWNTGNYQYQITRSTNHIVWSSYDCTYENAKENFARLVLAGKTAMEIE